MSEMMERAKNIIQRLSVAIAVGEIDQLISEAEDWTKDYAATPKLPALEAEVERLRAFVKLVSENCPLEPPHDYESPLVKLAREAARILNRG